MVGASWRFRVFAFWRRALARLLLALERARNASTQAPDLHGPSVYDGMITAGICRP
jgi:hypothetical protein